MWYVKLSRQIYLDKSYFFKDNYLDTTYIIYPDKIKFK